MNFTHQQPSSEESLNKAASAIRSSQVLEIPGTGRVQKFCEWIINQRNALLLNGGALEILSLIVAVFCFGVIVITLVIHHQKPLPQWPLDITINSLLSVFSQISQWSLAVPITECIGQLKFLWVKKERRLLTDFVAFQEATKGPWQSVVLLKRLRMRYLVSLGASVMLVLQAFSPFIQQAVTYPLRLSASGSAGAQRCSQFWMVDGVDYNLNQTYPVNSIKAGIYNGLFNPNASLSDASPTCSSGNCTWPQHTSLGICASMADVTSLVEDCSDSDAKSSNCIYKLPTGGILALGNESMTISTTETGVFNSTAFQDVVSLVDFYTFFTSNLTSKPVLLESVLYLCAQKYNMSVSNGVVNTTEIERWTNVTNTRRQYTVEVPSEQGQFLMGAYSFFTINQFLQRIFQGAYTVDQNGITYGSDAIEVLVDQLLVAPYDSAAMTIFLNSLTISMTNVLRTGAWADHINGTSWSEVSYVEVTWQWLALPSAIIIFTLIFMSLTIIKSNRDGVEVWKTSTLALLQALSAEIQLKLGNLSAESSMNEEAERLSVKLERKGDFWKIA